MKLDNPSLETDSTSSPQFARRDLLGRGVMAAAAGVAAAGLLATPRSASAATTLTFEANIPGTGDIKVLNFALATEQLAVALHEQALMRLTDGGANDLGTTIPGLKLDDDQVDVQYVEAILQAEKDHAAFLTKMLGSNAVSPFKYDFGYQTMHREQVLHFVYDAAVRDTRGYLGAITFFATRKYVLAAASINGDEARHAAIFGTVLNQLFNANVEVAPLASPFTDSNGGKDIFLTPDQVLAQVSPYIITS